MGINKKNPDQRINPKRELEESAEFPPDFEQGLLDRQSRDFFQKVFQSLIEYFQLELYRRAKIRKRK
jgi:hypothetical protein